MVFAINPGAEGSNNSFSEFQASALAVGAQLANATNATSTATSSGSNPSSTGVGGSKTGGAISMNIDGTKAMLMAGLGMVVSLMV
jgi:hypothetical protein